MKARHLKVALISIFVVASLAVPLLALTNSSEAKVNPDVTNIFVRGKDTAYSYNNNPPVPLKTYVQGDNPPMMMAEDIGTGRVVASGIITECRLNPSSDNFAALMDAIFQWLSSGKNVLWFDGYGVYCTSSACVNLIEKLDNKGYTITGVNTTPITSGMLAPYDILVLPELQLGSAAVGGDPGLLPDSDVQAIKGFVEGGKGLLIMCGSDFFGPGPKGNFYRVMNKVLTNLGFGYGSKLFGFQSDSVYDDVINGDERSSKNIDVPIPGGNRQYAPIVDVDTAHPIGATYQAATGGRNTIRAYGGCSLVQLGKAIGVYIIPSYQVGMPGETITYRVRVFNVSVPIPGAENVDLTIDLKVDDDSGWSPTLDNYLIRLGQDENQTVIMSVTIPPGAHLGTEDEIIVTATDSENSDVNNHYTTIAHAAKRLEVTQDSYVNSDLSENLNFGDNTHLNIGRYQTDNQWAYLMFENLDDIPPESEISEARLYLFAYSAYGAPQEMLACGVEDDTWYELAITWYDKPALGAVLDTKVVGYGSDLEPKPYYWDVTSFVQQEFAGDGDKIASFCVRPADNCLPSNNRQFEAMEWWDSRVHPFLQVTYTPPIENRMVSVSISPSYKSSLPGDNVTFTVTVKNEGNVSDTYSLSTADNASPSWSRTISPTSLPLAAGASGTATLTVTIPSGADIGTRDNIRVTATGTGVSAENSCIAQAGIGLGVEVSISPTSKDNSPGAALTYTVTVTNTGGVADNYVLTKSDNASWSLSLSSSTLSLAVGASGTATLTVTIPSDAENNTRDNVTVTATSQTNSAVNNSASCVARCVVGGVTENLVQVSISPTSMSNGPGEEVNFSVTVKNTGTSTDTFTLTASDTKGWGPTLSITSTTLAGGALRTGIKLSIKIPNNATDGDSTTITVTATSQTSSTVSASTTSTATTKAAGGIPIIILVAAIVVIVVIIGVVLVIKH